MASVPATRGGAAPAEPRRRARRGGRLDELAREWGELTLFAVSALLALPKALRYLSEVLRLNALITRRTWFLLLCMSAFLGISVANFGFFFLRSIGGGDFVGVFTGLLNQRQTAPTMFGYVVSASIGCAIAAELGSARIQQEIDAYEAQGIDPMELLVATRVLAVLLFVPIGSAIALIGGSLGGYVNVVDILAGNSSQVYIDTHYGIQSIPGQLYAAVAMGAVAVMCTIVACFYGLRTRGGPDAVGTAVARSLTLNLVLVHVITAFFGVLFYGDDFALPIGD